LVGVVSVWSSLSSKCWWLHDRFTTRQCPNSLSPRSLSCLVLRQRQGRETTKTKIPCPLCVSTSLSLDSLLVSVVRVTALDCVKDKDKFKDKDNPSKLQRSNNLSLESCKLLGPELMKITFLHISSYLQVLALHNVKFYIGDFIMS